MPWGLLLNRYVLLAVMIAALAGWGTFERWDKLRYKAIAAADEERIKALGVEIATQNAAVDKLKADGDKAMAKAEAGLKAVQAHVAGLQSEADRLKGLAAKAGQNAAGANVARPEGCPASGADKAVDQVRQGLR